MHGVIEKGKELFDDGIKEKNIFCFKSKCLTYFVWPLEQNFGGGATKRLFTIEQQYTLFFIFHIPLYYAYFKIIYKFVKTTARGDSKIWCRICTLLKSHKNKFNLENIKQTQKHCWLPKGALKMHLVLWTVPAWPYLRRV